jgi:hypothetical protein
MASRLSLHLAGLAPGESTQSFVIAQANDIPKKFIDTILSELLVAEMNCSK